MSTILTLKTLAVQEEDEDLKKKIRTLEHYLESHSKNIKVLIQDDGILVYSGETLLLKISADNNK